MAQRSIMSFFGAKSPPGQKLEQANRTISTDSTKQVLKSPVNNAKSKKIESPIKLSSPLSEKKDQLMLEESPASSPAKSVSDKSDEMSRHSENSVPDVVKTRKRRRISSSSSESSKSSSEVESSKEEEADEVVSIHSLSTDYNDIEMKQVQKSPESKKEAKEKKKPADTKKKTAATTKKTKAPAKKKTPAKSAKLSSPKKKEEEEDEVKPVVDGEVKKSPKKTSSSPKVEPKAEPKSAKGSKQEYDPMQDKYDPVNSATWKENEK